MWSWFSSVALLELSKVKALLLRFVCLFVFFLGREGACFFCLFVCVSFTMFFFAFVCDFAVSLALTDLLGYLGKRFFQIRVSVLVVFFIGRFNGFLVVCLTCVLMSVFHGYGQRL